MAQSTLLSVLIPTRKRVERLRKTIRSILDTAANPNSVEIVLRVDEDDADTIRFASSNEFPRVISVVKPRLGYSKMGIMFGEASAVASGEWCFLIDDDCWIEGCGPDGRKWDEQLSLIPTSKNIAQCEFYHLGGSKYGSGSCGPVGIMAPNRSWDAYAHQMDAFGCAADEFLRQILVVRQRFSVKLLRGIVYRHDRDSDDELKMHRQ